MFLTRINLGILTLWVIPSHQLISMLNDGMILVNTFEEPFGDECGKGVWSELTETTSSNIQRNIVALASFNGDRRSFACTDYFIEWNGCSIVLTSASLVRKYGYENKLDENLRIEVLLRNKQCGEGTNIIICITMLH